VDQLSGSFPHVADFKSEQMLAKKEAVLGVGPVVKTIERLPDRGMLSCPFGYHQKT
jgi:hypothetical protein